MIRPLLPIFLDIDGVLNEGGSRIAELEKVLVSDLGIQPGHTKFCQSCLTCKKALAYLVNSKAVGYLDNLLEKIYKFAVPQIIISSSWRFNCTVEQLKDIFGVFKFSQFITDKTPDKVSSLNQWKHFCNQPHFDPEKQYPAAITKAFYKAKDKSKYINSIEHLMTRCRASEINEWLSQHPKYIGYVIIDDNEQTHLFENFGNKYISTYHNGSYLLNGDDTDKIYEYFMECMKRAV